MKASKWLHLRAASLLLLIGVFTSRSYAAPGDVDLSFDPGSGVDGTVNSVVVQPDGKVIIGGEFSLVKGLIRSRIARLNADGSSDSSFAAIGDSLQPESVAALALQPDGKVLVGNLYGMMRLNSNGSLDTNFNAPQFPNFEEASVNAIVLQPDGKVLIAGNFSAQSGTNIYSGLARLNSDGTFDNTFSDAAPVWNVTTLALQLDGKVLVAGSFYINDTYGHGLVRLNSNGTLDNTFTPHDAPVRSIALQADGKVLVGIGGTVGHGRVTRLNTNGSVDATFAQVITDSVHGVLSVAPQASGKILVGGNFTINGTNRRLARLNSDGTFDPTFTSDVSGSVTFVSTIVLQPDGKAVIAGDFTAVNGIARHRVARLNADGSLDNSFDSGSGVDGSVSRIVVQPDGKALIAGDFLAVKSVASRGVARLNADGSGDSTFSAASVYGNVYSLAQQPDGKVLVAGRLADSPTRGLVRLHANGSHDSTFNPVIGATNSPEDVVVATAVAVQPDGKIVVGGYTEDYLCDEQGCVLQFTSFLGRLNTDGSRDTNFNATGFGLFYVIALQPDGRVLVGANGGRIIRLNANGSQDNTFSNTVTQLDDMVLQPDGKILFGGRFTATNGTSTRALARLNSNGTLDTSFTPATNRVVRSIALQPDGRVIVAETATVTRFNSDGSPDNTFNVGTVTNGDIRSIALQADGNVLVGGWFKTINGGFRPYLARLFGDSVQMPRLSLARSNSFVVLTWPAAFGNFQLQENTNLSLSNGWSSVAAPRSTNNGLISVALPTADSRKFLRLGLP